MVMSELQMQHVLAYLKREPEADHERVVHRPQELDLSGDVVDGSLLEAGLLVHVLHRVDLLRLLPLDEADLKQQF